MALKDRIQETIDSEDVVLFMKGTPEQVLCGNSARALEALRAVGAPVTAVDVLPDPAIRQELSALSNWPTIPQVFVRGELVGGADIVQELAETGELREKLDGALGAGWRERGREERTVALTDGQGPATLRLVP
jgi:monothiol glutaredoxin